MLTHLSIRDVVLIEKLDLPLHAGLTALTGETGAGKSILLDSLGLALGERTNSRIIRAGADQSRVTAVFELPLNHPVYALLQELDITSVEEGEPLVLRRVVTKDGRSRAYICDHPLGINVLRRVAALLVEIQGQHEQMGLADPSIHLSLLDSFGVPRALRKHTTDCWQAWQKAQKALENARKAMDDAIRDEEWLRHTIDDLSALAPQEGEEEELAAQRIQLQHDERRGEAVASALSELTPRDRRSTTPANALRAASRALARLLPSPLEHEQEGEEASAHQQQAQEALDALDKAEEALAEAETLLSRLAADTGTDTRLLEDTEERLFTLRAEARKHHISVADLPNFLTELKERLSHIEQSSEELSALEKAAKDTRTTFEQSAHTLSEARHKAASRLEKKVMAELKPLKLERARFIVQLTPLAPDHWNRHGMEQGAFLIAANPGQPPGPLGKVASGGELSRLMLALKVVLAGQSSLTTLVFDEVDSGVGGATASAIGERLHRVAQNVQVLAITHSPQVAARGDQQLRIAKRVSHNQTQTLAEPLSHDERREEIARMLAGNTVTDAARAAADSLLGSHSA
ncbi:DNA repair protein RecN [Saccharibacter floricola]|uniref:DNA repair protein RecN n=1 Tax=Saccharibacter floricola DSM 15669 TaxID=1123227 RepID=A0ABQ0NW00_9PROT|nr:DNA repair protein RecN [Saccharibacter floricola]GBQ04499.1 DNA repair protein RecN [Saccharibacter floricola DSM 15669]